MTLAEFAARPHSGARFLMCAPDHFGVTYAINPWMDPSSWARNDRALAAAARREWAKFHALLTSLGAEIDLIPPVTGLPDLVFAANSALVLDGIALLSRFRHPQRQGEEPHVEGAFRVLQGRDLLHSVFRLPDGLLLEGAGDCVWDDTRQLFWMGHGPRTTIESRQAVEEIFGVQAIALELADPRFYHMDTALSVLPGGEVMYIPGAFTAAGKGLIHELVAPAQRIPLGTDDACRLAANTVALGNTLVLSSCGNRLRAELRERGYRVLATSLASFQRSGGSAFCLTLRLDRRSAAQAEVRKAAATVAA